MEAKSPVIVPILSTPCLFVVLTIFDILTGDHHLQQRLCRVLIEVGAVSDDLSRHVWVAEHFLQLRPLVDHLSHSISSRQHGLVL